MTIEQIDNYKIDKSKWPRGEWDEEPDRIDFRHAGLPCLMLRNSMGAWCGYAGISPDHAVYGKCYEEVEVEAHWGLTYSDYCNGNICHIPEPGEADEVYWFGFDCAHSGDFYPPLAEYWLHGTYRNVAYVRREVEALAEQLATLTAARASLSWCHEGDKGDGKLRKSMTNARTLETQFPVPSRQAPLAKAIHSRIPAWIYRFLPQMASRRIQGA